MRQAYAGMLWSKQIFIYDVDRWYSGMLPFEKSFILQLKGVPNIYFFCKLWCCLICFDMSMIL